MKLENSNFYEVLLDEGETPNKCTIAPLTHRSDFQIIRTKNLKGKIHLRAEILLHMDGCNILDLPKSVSGIAAIDCVWRRLEPLTQRIVSPKWVRLPDGIQTAYPRRDDRGEDPTAGLATIEALFAARAILGIWDVSLLENYHFGRKFVEINADRFNDWGISQARDKSLWPVPSRPIRNSQQRRKNRGRPPIYIE